MINDYLAADTGMKVVNYIRRNSGGKVIAIDGTWGSGKTYLCGKISKQLNDIGYKSVILDAFANDYHNDALAVLAGVLVNMEDSCENKERLTKKLSKNLVPILKFGSITLLKGLAKKFAGTDVSDEKLINEMHKELIESAEAAIYNEIKNYGKLEESIKGIKEVVAEIASRNEDGLVVFVDDLDRCRPSFTIELIEKIKHIFECDNVTFVLSMNQEQIHNSISHVYGMNDDLARLYLNKFIARRFKLTSIASREGKIDNLASSKAYLYGLEMLKEIDSLDALKKELGDDKTIEMLALILAYHELTLRDINIIIDNMTEIIDLVDTKVDLAVMLISFQVSLVMLRHPLAIKLEVSIGAKQITSYSLNKSSADVVMNDMPLLQYMYKRGYSKMFAEYCAHMKHMRHRGNASNNQDAIKFFDYIVEDIEGGNLFHRMEEVAKKAIEIAV